MPFQSTPSAWRETLIVFVLLSGIVISIHSLRMEGDLDVMTGYCQQLWISIHSLRMEGDTFAWGGAHGALLFQSTPSAWRETCRHRSLHGNQSHFNPLPPHGGRLRGFRTMTGKRFISIHSLRMEGDISLSFPHIVGLLFQSTPSAWRETGLYVYVLDALEISIHSLRMEGDTMLCSSSMEYDLFQSTPSAWRETSRETFFSDCVPFQSTPSAWRETITIWKYLAQYVHFNPLPPHGGRLKLLAAIRCVFIISIHSLRMEGDDLKSFKLYPITLYFNPLPPHGGRPHRFPKCCWYQQISIHSLRMEGDESRSVMQWKIANFNPLPPHGGRLIRFCYRSIDRSNFNPLPPHGGRRNPLRPYCWISHYFNPLPPHGGRRLCQYAGGFSLCHFNPLPPHGGRLIQDVCFHTVPEFQSTPSAWRETGNNRQFSIRHFYFNPLPPHGGRLSC